MTNITDSKLPSYVKSRSTAIQSKWIAIFNAALAKHKDEKKALLLANTWLKKELGKSTRTVIKLEAVESKQFIQRDKDGNDYVTFVLSSTNTHYDGRKFSEATLKKWEKAINANPIIGDVDHKFYHLLANRGISDDTLIEMLKDKKGIAKTAKAIYEKGKLWVRAVIDKRYKRIIDKSRGVSVEAVCDVTPEEDKNWDLLGFTFNVDTNPADYSARIAT